MGAVHRIASGIEIPAEEALKFERSVRDIVNATLKYRQEDQRVVFIFYVMLLYLMLMQVCPQLHWRDAVLIAWGILLSKALDSIE